MFWCLAVCNFRRWQNIIIIITLSKLPLKAVNKFFVEKTTVSKKRAYFTRFKCVWGSRLKATGDCLIFFALNQFHHQSKSVNCLCEQNTKQNANGHFRLQSMCEILEESLYPAELSVYVMPFDMPKKKIVFKSSQIITLWPSNKVQADTDHLFMTSNNHNN